MSTDGVKKSGKGLAIFVILIALIFSFFFFFLKGNSDYNKASEELVALQSEGLPRPYVQANEQTIENTKAIATPAQAQSVKQTLASTARINRVTLAIAGNNFPLKITITGPRRAVIGVINNLNNQNAIDSNAQISGSTPLVIIKQMTISGSKQNSTLRATIDSGY